jgi:cell wall-associated NlpC family hydrolase
LLTLAIVTGLTSLVVVTARPAGASQLSTAKAAASAISAKLAQDSQELQTISGQVSAAQYQVAKLKTAMAASQAQLTADRAQVSKDQSQLRVQAVSDYTHNGSVNQISLLFASSGDSTSIRAEYTSIATGNVTDTIDTLHSAQAVLLAQENSLQQQQTQATAVENTVVSEENQAATLVNQQQAALNGANATVANLVAAQQRAAQEAAAQAQTAAFNARMAASRAAASSSRGPLPPLAGGAAGAVQAAESQIGVPYVFGGASPGRGFDCSGLVMWAYAQVGISLPHYSGAQYDDTTHIPLSAIAPGDLLFYGPGGSQHVAMYIGGGMMVEAPESGQSVHNTPVRTGGDFVGVGRVG